jgi:hypothetical protein
MGAFFVRGCKVGWDFKRGFNKPKRVVLFEPEYPSVYYGFTVGKNQRIYYL